MDSEEQLRKARALSEVSDADADTFARRVLQELQGGVRSGSRHQMKGPLQRRWGEFAAATAAVLLMFGGFSLYAVQHGMHLPQGTSAAANAPVQIGTAMVNPTDPSTFSRATLLKIKADLNQYNVALKPQDHEVYVLTGGIGSTDPQIQQWDSNGNMSFQAPTASYDITEQTQSPAWRIQTNSRTSVGLVLGGSPQSAAPLVPWVRHQTKAGQTYYDWTAADERMMLLYFQRGHTYVVVTITGVISGTKPVNPQSILSHFVPIGNPVIKSN